MVGELTETVIRTIQAREKDSGNGCHLRTRQAGPHKRMVQFADQTGLTIELVYYPPYHSQ